MKIRSDYLASPIVEITEERWDEMLGVLPPIAWKYEDGIERFNMSEFMIADVTQQFVKYQGKCYSLYVIHGDKATYFGARKDELNG
jgi:hypothetical protein